MKAAFSFMLVTVFFAATASAATLDCRLMGINDGPADVKPVIVNASAEAREIGSLGGEKIMVSAADGILEIHALGSYADVSTAAKTDEIYLSL